MSEMTGAPPGFGETPLNVEPPPVVTQPPPSPGPVAESLEPLDPWTSIWGRPRATMRQLLHGDSRRSVFLLAALGGTAAALKFGTSPGFGDTHSAAFLVFLALTGGALGGLFSVYVFGTLLTVMSRWLGGSGGRHETMLALAWAQVPQVWGLLLWLPRTALLGEETFHPLPAMLEGNPPAAAFYGFLRLGQALIDLWGFFICLKCIGEAQRFSAWRAFGSVLLSGLLLGAIVSVLMLAAKGWS